MPPPEEEKHLTKFPHLELYDHQAPTRSKARGVALSHPYARRHSLTLLHNRIRSTAPVPRSPAANTSTTPLCCTRVMPLRSTRSLSSRCCTRLARATVAHRGILAVSFEVRNMRAGRRSCVCVGLRRATPLRFRASARCLSRVVYMHAHALRRTPYALADSDATVLLHLTMRGRKIPQRPYKP